MSYKRYLAEKRAKACRREIFQKKFETIVKQATLKEDDEVLVPHPSSPRAFIVRKKK